MRPNDSDAFAEQIKLVVPQAVRDYAKSRNWERVQTKRNTVAVYRSPLPGRYEQLVVPMDPLLVDYAELMSDVIETLSKTEDRSPIEIASDLMAPEADTLRFANESLEANRGSIGILEGIELLEGAKRSILSSACSVLTPVEHHPR